jgi:hypothetical protein
MASHRPDQPERPDVSLVERREGKRPPDVSGDEVHEPPRRDRRGRGQVRHLSRACSCSPEEFPDERLAGAAARTDHDVDPLRVVHRASMDTTEGGVLSA